jgi:hypothetical protein
MDIDPRVKTRGNSKGHINPTPRGGSKNKSGFSSHPLGEDLGGVLILIKNVALKGNISYFCL